MPAALQHKPANKWEGQALDPNYRSELAETMLAECESLLDDEPGVGA